jgi:hypothetical protein
MSGKVKMAVGQDLGFGYAKTCYGHNKNLVIPSQVAPLDSALFGNHSVYNDGSKNYLVGEDAVVYGNPIHIETDSSYFRSNEYRVIGMYSLQQIGALAEDVEVNLVIGLPVNHYKDNKEKIEKHVKAWSTNLANVTAIPQPIGTIIDISHSWNGELIEDLRDLRIGGVDFGHGTIDAVEVVNGRPTERYAGASEGISRAYDEIFNHIQSLGRNIPRTDVMKYIKSPVVSLNGKEKNISGFVNDVLDSRFKAMLSLMRKVFPDFESIDRWVFSGGGSSLLDIRIKEKFGEKVLFPENPQLSNSNGFAKYAANQVSKPKSK